MVVVERVVVAAPGGSADAAMPPCPRCKASLFEGQAHGVKLLGCGVCGGVFLDNDGSARIVAAPDEEIAQLAERAEARAIAPDVDTRPAALACPVCGKAMRKVRAPASVELDICAAHGTWFDRSELVRVMRACTGRVDDDSRDRAQAELRLVALRDEQRGQIGAAEDAAAAGAFAGVTLGLLGILGALASSSSR
jgi:Zn-finger nucleic acid-binding protein